MAVNRAKTCQQTSDWECLLHELLVIALRTA